MSSPQSRSAWSEPGVETVAPGVHRIPLPLPGDGLAAVNVYAIEDAGRVCLIDAGWAIDEALHTLEEGLAAVGHGLDSVDRVLVTHMHRDHYTMAIRMRRLLGTRVEIGAGERLSLERLVAGASDGQVGYLHGWGAGALEEPLRRLQAAFREPELYELPDGWFEGSTDVVLQQRTLRAIPTPGHTRGHLVFADLDAGILFSGDHVLPHITPSIGFETVRSATALGDFLESLDVVSRLPNLVLLPAHGPAGGGHHQRVHELVIHHERRLDSTLRAVRDGAATAYECAQALPWTRRDRAFSDLDVFNQQLAVGETAAHLDLLVSQLQLTVREKDGVRRYAVPEVPSAPT